MGTATWRLGLPPFIAELCAGCAGISMASRGTTTSEVTDLSSGIKYCLRNHGKPPTIYSIARDPIMTQSELVF